MICPACGHVNRENAKFCDQCGVALHEPAVGAGAAGVGAASSPDPRQYTPKHLREKIIVGRRAMEGEHKQVTVLFADIQASMELAEQTGPERWHRILDRFFHIANDAVHRFEGTVNQYTGDGLMALFGAPIAQEDHAQRACHAALHLRGRLQAFGEELQRTHALRFAVRLGLNSGEVVVGKIGDDLRMDYTAQGHTVGIAQRVEQLAAPNSACLAQATAALVAGYFELRDLGAFQLKGVSEAVRVYELDRVGSARTRLDAGHGRRRSRFVGRATEWSILTQSLDDALAGHGGVVGVVGEAGVGKTRLCQELAREAGGRGFTVAQAHCPAHAASVEMLPILDLLRSLFDIGEREEAETARRKIRPQLRRLGRNLAESLPLVLDALGLADAQPSVPTPDDEHRIQLAAFLQRFVQAASAVRPLLLLIDDVHCIDPASEAVLGGIVEACGWTHTLLLVNFRPGYQAEWMGAPYYHELPVAVLEQDAVEALLRGLIGAHASTDGLRCLIRQHTGGNPFFVEEVVQSLLEYGALVAEETELGAGVSSAGGAAAPSPGSSAGLPASRLRLIRAIDELSIPPTVQALLTARIDRLGEREKLVLQAASIIGTSFSSAVLGCVLENELASGDGGSADEAVRQALAALELADFVHVASDEPDADHVFKHPLTRSVAYASQLGDSRARFHVAVARALQRLRAERLGQYATTIAHHYGAAGWKFEAARWRRRAALRVTSIELGRTRGR